MQFGGVFPRDKLPLSFILTIGVRWFIGLLGFVLNFSLVYVTWKTKTFRQLCNSLIAANAFFSGLFGLSLSIGWAFIIAGQPFIFEGSCVVLQAVPLLCRNLGLNLLFWIGFDRLISALFMNSFLHRHNSFYYFLITIGSASHAGYIVISVIGMAINYPDHITLCSTHDDTYVGPMTLTLMLVNVILSAIIFLVYVLLALVVKFKKETSVNSEVTRRLLRSLMAIMFVVVAGFTLNNFVNVLYSLLDTNITAITKAYTSMALSCLMAIAYASNAPLLIIFSTEYRKAYLRAFGPFLERLHLNTAAMSGTQKVHQTINNNNNNNSKTCRHRAN
uniref:G-protein coupled receptors family 1 profile domain-containing protein n=1 Tax=Globodera rostochiensis TaxID=31243 RepID=A0A914GTP9_GLORO